MNFITPNITDRLVEYFVVVGYGNKLIPLDSQWINDPFAPPPNIDDGFNPQEDVLIEDHAHEIRYGINDFWGGPETDSSHPNATISPDPAGIIHHDKARPAEVEREDMSLWPEERIEALIAERLRVQESLLVQVQQHLFNVEVLDRYPYADTKHMPFPQGIPLFCMPEGGLRLSLRSDIPKIYYFCCTLSNGDKLYGACLSFLEQVPLPHLRGLLRRMDADEDNHALWTSHVPSPLDNPSGTSVSINPQVYASVTGVSAATVPQPVLARVRERVSEALARAPRMWSSRCLCVLSHFPFFPQYRAFLSELYRLSLSPLHVPLERYISLLVDDTPLPPSGVYAVQLNIGPYTHQPCEDDEKKKPSVNECRHAPQGVMTVGASTPSSSRSASSSSSSSSSSHGSSILTLDPARVLPPSLTQTLAPLAAAAIVDHRVSLSLSSASLSDLPLPPPPRCLVHSIALDTLPLPTHTTATVTTSTANTTFASAALTSRASIARPPAPPPTSRFSLSFSRPPPSQPTTPTSTSLSSAIYTPNPLLTQNAPPSRLASSTRAASEPFACHLSYPPPVSFTPLLFSRPPVNLPLLPLAVSVHPLLHLLSPEHIVVILEALLSERKVLILSERLSLLAPVCEALQLLLYPFKWPHVYIPLLPKVLNAFVHAPMPYLIGTHSATYNNLDPDILADVVVVWLDKGRVDAADMPIPLPSRERQKLLKKMSVLVPAFLSAARRDAAYHFLDSDDAFTMPPLPEDADGAETVLVEDVDGEERLPNVPELASPAAKGEYRIKRAFFRVFLSLFRSLYDYLPSHVDPTLLHVSWPQQPATAGARFARVSITEVDSVYSLSSPLSRNSNSSLHTNTISMNRNITNTNSTANANASANTVSSTRSPTTATSPSSPSTSLPSLPLARLSVDPSLPPLAPTPPLAPETSFLIEQIPEPLAFPTVAADRRYTTWDPKQRTPDLRRSSSFSGPNSSSFSESTSASALRQAAEEELDDPEQLFRAESFLRAHTPARAFLEPFFSTQMWQVFIDERCSPSLASRNAAHVIFFAESLTEKRNRSLFKRSRLTPFLDSRVATSVCTVLVASPQGLDRGLRHYNQYHRHYVCLCRSRTPQCSHCSRALVDAGTHMRCVVCQTYMYKCTSASTCLQCSCQGCPHASEKAPDVVCATCADTNTCSLAHLATHTHEPFLDRLPRSHTVFPRLSRTLFPNTAARVPRIVSLDGALLLVHAQLMVGLLLCSADHAHSHTQAHTHAHSNVSVVEGEAEMHIPLRKQAVDALLPMLARAPSGIVAWEKIKRVSLVFRWSYSQTAPQHTVVVPCGPLPTKINSIAATATTLTSTPTPTGAAVGGSAPSLPTSARPPALNLDFSLSSVPPPPPTATSDAPPPPPPFSPSSTSPPLSSASSTSSSRPSLAVAASSASPRSASPSAPPTPQSDAPTPPSSLPPSPSSSSSSPPLLPAAPPPASLALSSPPSRPPRPYPYTPTRPPASLAHLPPAPLSPLSSPMPSSPPRSPLPHLPPAPSTPQSPPVTSTPTATSTPTSPTASPSAAAPDPNTNTDADMDVNTNTTTATCVFIWLSALAPLPSPPSSLTDTTIAEAAETPMHAAITHLEEWVRTWFKKGKIPGLDFPNDVATDSTATTAPPGTATDMVSSPPAPSPSARPLAHAASPPASPASPASRAHAPATHSPLSSASAASAAEGEEEDVLQPLPRFPDATDRSLTALCSLPSSASLPSSLSSTSSAEAPAPATDKSIAFLSSLSSILSHPPALASISSPGPMGLHVSVPDTHTGSSPPLYTRSLTHAATAATTSVSTSTSTSFDSVHLLVPLYADLLACALSAKSPENTRTPGTATKPIDLCLRRLHRLFIPNWVNVCVGRTRYDALKLMLRHAARVAGEYGVTYTPNNATAAVPAPLPFSPTPAPFSPNPLTPTANTTAPATAANVNTGTGMGTPTPPPRTLASATSTPRHARTSSIPSSPITPLRSLSLPNTHTDAHTPSPSSAFAAAAKALGVAIPSIQFSCCRVCQCGVEVEAEAVMNAFAERLLAHQHNVTNNPNANANTNTATAGITGAGVGLDALPLSPRIHRKLSLSHLPDDTPPLTSTSATASAAVSAFALSPSSASACASTPTSTSASTTSTSASMSESLIHQRVRMLSVCNPAFASHLPPHTPSHTPSHTRTASLASPLSSRSSSHASTSASGTVAGAAPVPQLLPLPSSSSTSAASLSLSSGVLYPHASALAPTPTHAHTPTHTRMPSHARTPSLPHTQTHLPHTHALSRSDLYTYTQLACPSCQASFAPTLVLSLAPPASPSTLALTDSLYTSLVPDGNTDRHTLTIPLLPPALVAQELAKLLQNRNLDYFLGAPFRNQHPILFFTLLWWCAVAGLDVTEIWGKHAETALVTRKGVVV